MDNQAIKKVAIICSVRNASKSYRKQLEKHAEYLESQNKEVHLPHRDTDQEAKGIDICRQNMKAIKEADEIHIFYNPDSTGTHFDLGMAFMANKPIRVIENVSYGEGKSFAKMIEEWHKEEEWEKEM